MESCKTLGRQFKYFFDKRSFLIVEYEKGNMTKREFLESNYYLVMNMNIKPFLRIDSFEMGMYNYQYYNALAKYFTMLAKDVRHSKKKQKYYKYYLNKGNNYYHEKDKAVLDLLNFLDFKGVEAYYIDVNSKNLNNKLYEIVLLDYKDAIFHSKASWLLNILKEKGVFKEIKRKSLIDDYINETY
ncbi:MAG TPA: DUF6648 family protein [Tissierellaceae bacterium]